MKRAWVTLAVIMISIPLMMVSCGENKTDRLAEAKKRVLELDSLLHDRSGNIPGHTVAEEAMAVFRDFGNTFPEDTFALKYHTMAADLAFTLQRFRLSAEIFEEVVALHPDSDHLPYLYIRLGNVYNDKLNDTTEAKRFFTMVLDRFPDDPHAESAQFGLETLGMSEDEQFQVILQRNAMLAEE